MRLSPIPEGSFVKIIQVHKEDAWYGKYTALEVKVTKELTEQTSAPGYYRGTLAIPGEGDIFFYAIQVQKIERKKS